jgi:RIO-like serine/threonine protein kinase
MEYAENFKQLFKLMPDKNYETYKNMSRYLLLRLAIETEYNHSDFHKYNILINQEENTYFNSLSGYPLLIDFSWVQKIPSDKLEIIKKYYNEKKYIEALDILYKMKRRDDIDLEEHEVFNWMSKNIISINKTEKINNEIDNLINLRNTAIENMKKHSALIPLNDILHLCTFKTPT